LLAVRVRTLDNKLIRIPNEMVLKQPLVNLTFYPTKRVDLVLSILYNDNFDIVKQVIVDVLARNPLFLKNPEPVIKMNKIVQPDFSTETRIHIVLRVWVNKDKFFTAAGVLVELLKKELDQKNIVITVAQVN